MDKSEGKTNKIRKYKWIHSERDNFIKRLNDKIIPLYVLGIEQQVKDGDMEKANGILCNMLYTIGKEMIAQSGNKVKPKKSEWFDEECEEARRELKTKLRRFRRERDVDKLTQYTEARKAHKTVCRTKRTGNGEKWMQELNGHLQRNDHTAAWRMIKQLRNKTNNN